MTETELLTEVIDLCEEFKLLWHHCKDSRWCHGQRGFPDLVVAGPGGHLLRELKGEYGETSAEQDLWGYHLYRAGTYPERLWAVWNPSDLRTGIIRQQLASIA